MNIPFSPPDITEEEINEVVDTLRSGWITTGPRTKKFEGLISEWCQTKRAVCLNSATACMEMTLHLLHIGPGDEVILPAYTYTATASVVVHVGATPVLIDCKKDSFEMDYDKMEQAITERTKAIIPVDFAGVMCDYQRIFKAVNHKKDIFMAKGPLQKLMKRVTVISDSAHAFGATYEGKPSGQLGDFTSFSFHAVKNLTTSEGGAVVWREIPGMDSDEIYRQYMLLSLHGQSKDALAKTQAGSWEYDIMMPAYKCNMTDIMAAIGLVQIKRYPALLARRSEIISRYNFSLSSLNVTILEHNHGNSNSSGHLYILRLNGFTLEMRNSVIVKMAERGISTNVHYKPLPLLTAYKDLGFDIKDYPNAYAQYANEITLPLHTSLTDEQIDYVIENLVSIVAMQE